MFKKIAKLFIVSLIAIALLSSNAFAQNKSVSDAYTCDANSGSICYKAILCADELLKLFVNPLKTIEIITLNILIQSWLCLNALKLCALDYAEKHIIVVYSNTEKIEDPIPNSSDWNSFSEYSWNSQYNSQKLTTVAATVAVTTSLSLTTAEISAVSPFDYIVTNGITYCPTWWYIIK